MKSKNWKFSDENEVQLRSTEAGRRQLQELRLLSCRTLKQVLILICILLLSTHSLCAYDIKVDGICYNIKSNNTLQVANSGEDVLVDLVIPSEVIYENQKYTVVSIERQAFKSKSKLTSVVIPNTVKNIDSDAFYWCQNLQSVVLPDSIDNISQYCFWGCTNLESIDIPEMVTDIGPSAFGSCYALKNLVLPDSLEMIGDQAFGNCQSIEAVVIPSTVTRLSRTAFQGCSKLKTVTMLNAIETLENDVFNGCLALEKITLPATIKSIGNGAFANCQSLTNLNIPENLISIGDGAFENCYKLQDIEIPNRVSTIGTRAFVQCDNFKSIVLPQSLSVIRSSLFLGCDNLESVVIPESVATIEPDAFRYCSMLDNVVIPASITTIGSCAFAESGLSSLVISDSVESVGSSCFSKCAKLKTVDLGNALKTIEPYAFSECHALSRIVIPNTVESIGNDAFSNCGSLSSINLPPNLKEISYNLLRKCSSLTSIVVPDSVQAIGGSAFKDCLNLQSIILPKSLIKMESSALTGCPLVKIECKALTPPVIAEFEANVLSNATLYVPVGTKETYKVTEPWSQFVNIEESTFKPAILVAEIALNCTSANLKVGESTTLKARVFPDNATNAAVVWTSGNKNVAVVSSDGAVTAKAVGETTVTVSAADGSGAYAVCGIIVAPFAEPEIKTNRLEVDSQKVFVGKEYMLPIKLINDKEFTAFQFDVHLPVGVEIPIDQDGYYMMEFTDRISSHHIYECALQSTGAIRFIVYSARNTAFTGNEGVLVNMPIKINDSAVEGDNVIRIENINFTSPTAEEEFFDNISAVLAVKKYLLGDANGDNKVSLADVVSDISFILGQNPVNFNEEAADYNEDGKVSLADVVAVITTLLTGSSDASPVQSHLPASVETSDEPLENALSINEFMIHAGETQTLTIDMTNTAAITAVQFDIKLPKGLSISLDEEDYPNVFLTTRSSRHTLEAAFQSNGSLRVIAYSSSNRVFKENAGGLVDLEIVADASFDSSVDGAITVSGVELIDTSAFTHQQGDFEYIIDGKSSGAEVVGADLIHVALQGGEIIVGGKSVSDKVEVYNIEGRLVYAGNDAVISVAPNSVFIVKIRERVYKLIN